MASFGRVLSRYFNPPTPCGVGQVWIKPHHFEVKFQSTHPVWGGTAAKQAVVPGGRISIHPPRVGWDMTAVGKVLLGADFNPPTPCGVGQNWR